MRYLLTVLMMLGAFLALPEVTLNASPGPAELRPEVATLETRENAVSGEVPAEGPALPEVLTWFEDRTERLASFSPPAPVGKAPKVVLPRPDTLPSVAHVKAVGTVNAAPEIEVAEIEAPMVEEVPPVEEVLVETPAPASDPAPEVIVAERQPVVPETEAASALPRAEVTASALNMRAGPSSRTEVVGALRRGDVAVLLGEERGSWVRVRVSDGREGWVFGRYLDPAQDV